MSEYIYGLDLSLSCSGVVIFEDSQPLYIGNIPTKSKDSHGYRLKQIYDELIRLKEICPPKVICIERGFYRFNKSSEAIWKVHGVVNLAFYDCGIIYYSPKEVKSAILNGKATKEELMDKIHETYPNIKFRDDNESDAFAVALTYLKMNT